MHNSSEFVKNNEDVLQERYQELCDAMDWVGFTDQVRKVVILSSFSLIYLIKGGEKFHPLLLQKLCYSLNNTCKRWQHYLQMDQHVRPGLE